MNPDDQPDTGGKPRGAAATVGQRLRKARESRKLSLQDIAERTRVPARHLSAIEEGRYGDLPAVTYSSGFARAFAQAVGLDPSDISAQYRAEANPDPLPYYDLHEPLDPARVPSTKVAWIAGAIGAAVVALLIAFSMGVFSRSSNDDSAQTANTEQQPMETPPPPPAPAAMAPAAGPSAPTPQQMAQQPASPLQDGPVVLTASEDAWIKVYDRAGQTVRMGILKANESYAVPGDPNQLLLWTGKAGAVRITVGGKPVAPLGQLIQTVRDVSLAPASLLTRGASTSTPQAAQPSTEVGR